MSDADAIARTIADSRRSAGALIPPPVHSISEDRAWVRRVVLVEQEVWVVDHGASGIVGVLALSRGWIEQLYVLADFAGCGIGSALVAVAKQRHPTGLQLWTFASNSRARRFYAHHGFIVAEETDGSGNEERSPDVRMTWAPTDWR